MSAQTGSTNSSQPTMLSAEDTNIDDDVDLRRVWQVLIRGKWLISSMVVLCGVIALIYGFVATEWWDAEIVIAPSEQAAIPAVAGQLGGLAALAGLNLGGSSSQDAFEVLRSREFTREFIKENDLVTVLFEDEWDAERGIWRSSDPRRHYDVRDAAEKFQEEVMTVYQDSKTGVVTLSIRWKDPSIAAEWANDLIRRVNLRLRERAVRQAEKNLTYLSGELSATNVVGLQQSISRLIESEMQKLMLARGNEEFAFRVLDSPVPPKERSWPKRMLVLILGLMTGGATGVILALAADIHRNAKV